ncbi:MAG: SPOR domain-containing protein [Novosphingobium sp.]|nr:SPOR domain-containing protein [Novosphingobium sp.]
MRETFQFRLALRQLMTLGAAALAFLAFALPASVFAQPVVQRLPSPEAQALNAALTRLARNPRDVTALIEAGNAAMALGDFEAAGGFFRRASETQPRNGRAKAGLAGALVLGGDPYSAIPLFDEAAKAGADTRALAAERGLAYDLVGANALAQGFYRKALARDRSGEIRRRLALSLAIGGDGAAAEAMLLPQLRAQFKPAWRTRAFVLAITGRTKEAVDVTNTLLPSKLARNIVPYLRYMPQLTPAQQAAAANLGKFPRASEIGRDDPRIAAYASLAPPRENLVAVDAALVPQGEPLGSSKKRARRRDESSSLSARNAARKAKAKQERRERREKRNRRNREKPERVAMADKPRVAPPEPKPAREIAAVSQPTLAAAVENPVMQPKPEPKPQPSPKPPTALAKPANANIPIAKPEAGAAKASGPVPVPSLSTNPASTENSSPAKEQAAKLAQVIKAQQPASMGTTHSPPPSASRMAVTLGPAASKPATEPAPALATPTPGFDLAMLPNSRSGATGNAAVVPSTPTTTAPTPKKEPGFADLFGDLGRPAVHDAPAAGAVDIRKIEPAKPKPKPKKVAPKPAPPSHPSRIWVQLGIGQNVAALKYDWRRLNRQQATVFKGRNAYVSDLGKTNRMLTGPFESRKAANGFLAKLTKAGLDGPYLWISPAGQVVDQISN